MIKIEDLRNLCTDKNIVLTTHAKKRLKERGINLENIKNAIFTGEVIEQYPNNYPYPSCLLLGKIEHNKHIHIVASIGGDNLYIITVYCPDEHKWEINLKTRREH